MMLRTYVLSKLSLNIRWFLLFYKFRICTLWKSFNNYYNRFYKKRKGKVVLEKCIITVHVHSLIFLKTLLGLVKMKLKF